MKFIALKTCEGGAKGRISFCCKALKVTRQGFHEYLKNRNKPWKHEELAAKMMEILSEDECNDTYGRERMHKALLLKYPNSGIPSETTVYCVMTAIGITHRPNRKPNCAPQLSKIQRQHIPNFAVRYSNPTGEASTQALHTELR